MEEKKLTDEDIIMAYKRCIGGSADSCTRCPYATSRTNCEMKKLYADILDLIHRLQRECAKQKAKFEKAVAERGKR